VINFSLFYMYLVFRITHHNKNTVYNATSGNKQQWRSKGASGGTRLGGAPAHFLQSFKNAF